MNVFHIQGRRGSWGSADEGCSGARSAPRPRPPSRPVRPPRTALRQRPRPGWRTAPGITATNDGSHGGDASAGQLYGARFTHWNISVINQRAGCVKLDEIAPYSATVGISEVSEFRQVDQPDFTGALHTRAESYGHPEAVTPPNLYEAQRPLRR